MKRDVNQILCVGDLALDVIAKIDGVGLGQLNYGSDTPSKVSTHGGGAAANVAAWLRKIDIKPTLITRIGDDLLGQALLKELEDIGIICHTRVISHLSTGTVIVLVDQSGERTMLPDSGANAGLTLADLPSLEHFAAAYISGYALWNKSSHAGVGDIFRELNMEKIPVIFDPASVGTMEKFSGGNRELILHSMPKSEVMILYSTEAQYLSSESDLYKALEFLKKYAKAVLIKLGDNGAIAQIENEIYEVATEKVEPIDTTGAGDSFAAGFIGKWVASQDMKACLEEGNRLASQCVQIIGARPLF